MNYVYVKVFINDITSETHVIKDCSKQPRYILVFQDQQLYEIDHVLLLKKVKIQPIAVLP